MTIPRCSICGDEVRMEDGGAVLMIALRVGRHTSMASVAFCADSYKRFIKDPLRELSNCGCLELIVESGDKEETEK